MLAFLAMPAGQPRSRDMLCGLLWGDRAEKQARDSLKQALCRLRSCFGSAVPLPILADRVSLTLDDAPITTDVREFESLIGEGTLDAVAAAATLYRGDLLEGLDVRDAPFEEWLLIERQRLRSRLLDRAEPLLERYAASKLSQTGELANRLLALDPLREAAHRALMRLYREQRRTAQALRQYQVCRGALHSELGVEPEAETQRLYQSIKNERAREIQTQSGKAAATAAACHSTPAPVRVSRGALPERLLFASGPSIAVLPFVNKSGDPRQDCFADGLTEDIITDLSRWRRLAVSSRHSTFPFKGKLIDAQRVGRDLGVRFLVEGSVRQRGERLRITAQLIDIETGSRIWVERFDRLAMDLFDGQDEVVQTIVGTLVGRLQASETTHARRKPASALAAYDLTLRGNALSWDDPASAAEAKRAFEGAIEIDPAFARPYSLLATMLGREWRNDLSASDELLDRALALARRAVELAEDDSTCHTALGYICFEQRRFDLALGHYERGVEVNPANPWNQVDLGYLLSYIGRAEEALEILRNARRKDPYLGPPWYWRSLGVAQFVLGRYADALADFDRGAANCPRYALAMMAGCCAKLGLAERTRETMALCSAGEPEGSMAHLLARIPFKHPSDHDHLVECLRLAGAPQ